MLKGLVSPEFKMNAVNVSSFRDSFIPLDDGKELPKRLEGNHLFKYSKVKVFYAAFSR